MRLKSLFILYILIFIPLFVFSQQNQLDSGKKYTIGEITVSGAQSFNELTVITFSGLKKGEEIYIPGQRISNVIKKLWDENLFSDVNIYVTDIQDNIVDLEINITELPTLNETTITGIRKGKAKELLKELDLTKGKKVTKNLLTTTENFIKNKYKDDGFFFANVMMNTNTVVDSTGEEIGQNLNINIDRGKKVKVKKIHIAGNNELTNAKVRRSMKNTKQKNPIRIFKRSKYIKSAYEEDKASLVSNYKEKGYRDARIVSDSLAIVDEKNIELFINLEEGRKHYFGDIRFIGNSIYTDQELKNFLGIQKGDTYNGVLLQERIADDTDPDADDLTNAYQNNGYLFSRINPVEVNIQNDTIDFEIRIYEGRLAYFNNVTVVGNDKTNDHVIYRELRVRPGQKYSKRNVVRTIRELGQLGFFDPETIAPEFKNVDPNTGTLDMEFRVEESGASQIELQGGYGGGGFVGTLGLSFNNFSLRNIFNGDAYRPLPMGDGQKLSLRAQASSFYQTYSLSLVEPWLGGKKPVQFSLSFSHTIQYFYDFREREADRDRRFLITGGSIGLAKRLRWPDDHFVLSHAISFQHYNLKNYNTGLFTFGNGFSNNLAYTIGVSRNNTFTNPVFPLGGSEFNVTAKLTPPYSLFNNVKYSTLDSDPEFQNPDGSPNQGLIDQKRFNWLEYYKIKFKGTWYTNIIDKLVLRPQVEFGFLGAYNLDRGVPPFERFFMGGDGLGAFSLDGREIISLRGYPNQSLSDQDGNTIFNKFSLELRYPITLKQMASIYALTFIEGGATYDGFKNYNPFQLKRSAGAGIRIFMPAFGLLGIDFGYGFDPIPGTFQANGWETHFIIGQQF
ncbi:outer membrane protein assembly factor BamA [Planktosalinus lacus]|uniref:Outer membrane protein assembly factor BamA n=1 Tax=Planktosalinus lacus TaxID=1526573 RepID=A0A8J2VFF1_9FLAO|nr:outer membrane protein assembly factor BamA [Planktosalinus lacus]GGE01770.1 outer membrane protein assembly factor BamA [Planktosalinus lacus]